MLVAKNTPRSTVFRYLGQGLSLIPLKEDKTPKGSWKQSQYEIIPYNYEGDFAGLICGQVSGNVEVIDFDLKYAKGSIFDKDNLFYQYCRKLCVEHKPLLKKLVTQTTKNGGYHFIYRCSEIQGNQSLAKRFTTAEERLINPNERTKVLIETRGEGGYIVIAPSPGYELTQGSFLDIPEITPEERRVLLDTARSFNQVQVVKPKRKPSFSVQTNSPFKAKAGTRIDAFGKFCEVVPILDMLLASGWEYVSNYGDKILVKRPGETDAAYSGNIKEKLFRCHSSSTEFDPEKTYNPVQAFAMLRYGTLDLSAAAADIHRMGFGKKRYTDSELINKAIAVIKRG